MVRVEVCLGKLSGGVVRADAVGRHKQVCVIVVLVRGALMVYRFYLELTYGPLLDLTAVCFCGYGGGCVCVVGSGVEYCD